MPALTLFCSPTGHIVRVQSLNDPTTPTASQSNLLGSRRRSPNAASDDDTPEMQIMVVTEIAVVILTYPYLEFVADMSHGVKALDKDRVATTLDAHLLHVEGDNRVHVLGCRKDTSWAVHPRLHFPRPAAAETSGGGARKGEEAEMDGMLVPASTTKIVPLVPLPPRPTQPTSVLGSLLSYLPFGTSDAGVSATTTGADGMSAQDAALAKQLNDAFGVVDQASVGANAAAHQAMDALKKRGEKLDVLEQKFSQLSEGTSQFAKMAKQIREAEEKKKWYHF
ncbi:hypothetical protein BCR44DRAFT_217075 [Catenaria anguillulae PL171]|uniref:V-SNARE coiled-coil homology domain-containing protein n=1 Tax=Catenaria anguillulae PL171 TaxID=765915 RepID=A0A1Y2HSJ4_9FUNG|nr:hypothetical protein BCR44DRAFT_217075 [Catenaria anguillulae PL171]